MFKHSFSALLAAALVLLPCASPAAPSKTSAPSKTTAAPADKQLPVVRVNVTTQAYDFIHPWAKKAPYTHRALGAVLSDNRVLVTAELVQNSTYVEFEKPEGGDRTPATVETVDYETNLAILKPVDEKFLQGIKPMEIKDAKVGDAVSVWQLENTGSLLNTSALMTTVEVSRYPLSDTPMLIYRLTSSLQYRDSSFTVPVAKDGKLVGFMMRYDSRTQNVDIIPAPVIEHFLAAAAKKEYAGVPSTGVYFAPLRNPALRDYAGLKPEDKGGVYVTQVLKNGPGDVAGMQVGDVVLAVNDKPIDQDGNYVDPEYGKLLLINLISTKSFDGDVLKFKIARNGEIKMLDVKVTHRDAADYVIPPYVIDKAPKYYVLGGLVIQELSRQYLREWGAEWYKKAPQRFVYMDQYQSELYPDGNKKVIILSQVLPTPSTLGYEDLGGLVITKINDKPINSMTDVADALKAPVDGYYKIEFNENPKLIYLDAKDVEAGADSLKKNYGLRSLKRLD